MLFFRKYIIALTGLFLCLFLVVHFAANALLLLPESTARNLYNAYSTALRNNLLIKVISIVLMLSILLHMLYAWIVTRANKQARPHRYAVNRAEENSTWTSQNMGLLGVGLLLFLIVHLAHFWMRIKLGVGAPVGVDPKGHVDVYDVAVQLFRQELYVVLYAALMFPLGLHLHHGLKSAFMTLGFHHRKGLDLLEKVSVVYAFLIAVGFAIIPVVVYLKLKVL